MRSRNGTKAAADAVAVAADLERHVQVDGVETDRKRTREKLGHGSDEEGDREGQDRCRPGSAEEYAVPDAVLAIPRKSHRAPPTVIRRWRILLCEPRFVYSTRILRVRCPATPVAT